MAKRLTPETQAKRAIKHFLKSLGIFHFPVLQGLGAYKGISDILGVYNGRMLAIEVKAAGGRLSDYQKIFLDKVKANGGIVIVAYSIDDVIKGLGLEDRFIMP